jgi:hypothetical protein
MGYDLIGDIHGEAPTLKALLERLGYQLTTDGYSHPENRTVIFVGDLIDRGHWQKEVISTVRVMTEAGNAICIMGNHEFNAIAYGTVGPNGRPLREHSAKNVKQHKEFIAAFRGAETEYRETLEWLKTLPLWIDLPELRVIHACWDQAKIELLSSRHAGPRLTDNLLVQASTYGTKEYRALETLLKGKEVALPDGASYHDKEGTLRTVMRTQWLGGSSLLPRLLYGTRGGSRKHPGCPDSWRSFGSLPGR